MSSLLQRLEETAAGDESIFRRQLAKEDIKRFEKLAALVKTCSNLAVFQKDGLYIGWTQNDMKTHELRDVIIPLLETYYAYCAPGAAPEQAAKLDESWNAFHRERMEKLIHCL